MKSVYDEEKSYEIISNVINGKGGEDVIFHLLCENIVRIILSILEEKSLALYESYYTNYIDSGESANLTEIENEVIRA